MKFLILKLPVVIGTITGVFLSSLAFAQQGANPAATQPPTASVAESVNQEQQQPSSRKKKAAAAPSSRTRPRDRGLTEDEESALPIKSKFRYGNEDIEVDPD